MTYGQRRNRLTTHFSERNPFAKRRISVCVYMHIYMYKFYTRGMLAAVVGNIRQSDLRSCVFGMISRGVPFLLCVILLL